MTTWITLQIITVIIISYLVYQNYTLRNENTRLKDAWKSPIHVHWQYEWFSAHTQGKAILDGIYEGYKLIQDLVSYPSGDYYMKERIKNIGKL